MSTHLRIAADPAEAESLFGIEPSVTVETAARCMSVDTSTIRKMLKAGQLRGHRAGVKGRAVRVYAASITEYQQARAIGQDPAQARPKRQQRATAAHNEALASLRALGVL